MKQNLQLKISQNLALTPQLQQSIRLLQLSSQELNQELEVILQANPLLERDEKNNDGSDNVDNFVPSSATTSVAEKSNPETSEEAGNTHEEAAPQENFREDFAEFSGDNRWDDSRATSDDDNDFTFQEAVPLTLRDHLLGQLKLLPLSGRDQTLAMFLIDELNDDGYLDQPLEELADLLSEETEIDPLELQTALKHIQHLDPAGVGAQNLAECLTLQLQAMPEETPHLNLAIAAAKDHLPLLANRDYAKLKNSSTAMMKPCVQSST